MNTSRSLPPLMGQHSGHYQSGGSPVGYYEKPKPAGESRAPPRIPTPRGKRSILYAFARLPKTCQKRKRI